MERLTIFDGEFWVHKKFPPVEEDRVDEFIDCVKELAARLAAYEDTGLEPQSVRLLADAICGKTDVFCPVCGDGLCLAAGKNGLQIGCFGCGEYVPVKELFEAYRRMKEGE
ncbi:MAG TPA: hypothetical protein IAB55_06530 [Candidatus Merdivicinus faecavium]|nr:hypothetical protein [Candidatus Merdivicinus faecavium]